MKKVNQIEIKIRDISFVPEWNTLVTAFICGRKVRSSLLYLFDTNRQGLQARIISKAMQRYLQM